MRYEPNVEMLQRLKNEFTYHSPKNDQQERYVMLRDIGRTMAIAIVEMTPPSREQSLALTKLNEVVMWSNAAIERHDRHDIFGRTTI